jgi:dipeptidyl aminopeptidase/acylaminoacyl peptidase
MTTPTDHWSNEPGRWEATLTPEAYALIARISIPKLSPDRRQVAYLRSYDGRSDVWVMPLDGHAIQITDYATPQGADPGQRQAFPLAWSPDSQTVVYASTREGKLWSVPAGGGAASSSDEGPGNHHSPAVSPDGATVAYVGERGEKVDIFVASMDGSRIQQISDPNDDGYVSNPQWSPDGRSLLYVRWPHYDMPWDEIAIVVADIASGELTSVAGGHRVANNWPAWSPDGEFIVFLSDRDREHPNLWRMRADGSDAECLVDQLSDHRSPAWSPDGSKIAYTVSANCEAQIWVWENGAARQLTDVPGVHGDLSWVDNNTILCTFESPLVPADLYLIGLDGSRQQLTRSATGGVLGGDLVLPQVISWTSHDDLVVEGMLFTPQEERPGEHPLVVHIHGGPVGQASKNWTPWIQYLVQRGYVVLVPNYRGSKGYGRSFMEALYGDWGGGDLDDYITGADAVIARGLVHPGRVVATGGSAGGYSTLICMTKAPEYFKAGICRFGIADLTTFHENTWIFERHYVAKLMGGTGGQLGDLYRDRSPINFIDDVRNPLLILQGQEDIVCHPSEMDKMTAALEKAGKDVEYHTYPGEGHGWKKVSTVIDDAYTSDAFLVRAVLNR